MRRAHSRPGARRKEITMKFHSSNVSLFHQGSSEARLGVITRNLKFQAMMFLIGLTVLTLLGSSASLAADKDSPGWQLTTLYAFTGEADGSLPAAGVVLDSAGNVYGTTPFGGTFGGSCPVGFGCGVAFKVDPKGHETVLHSFTGGADGAGPYPGGLLRDGAGLLYGTAESGGTYNLGTVFKLQPFPRACVTALCPWNETVLYSFGPFGSDGSTPSGTLIQDAEGNFYGATQGGTGNGCGGNGCGTVFKLDTHGKETILYSFQGPPADGSLPNGTLIRDAEGNLYGTAFAGGGGNCSYGPGCGVVFKIDTSNHYSIIWTFTGAADGSFPEAGLIQDGQGNLYGTASSGGISNSNCFLGCGVVFELIPSGSGWMQKTLYSFTGDSDGGNPWAGLLRDSHGNLYSTTLSGGEPCSLGTCGVVFRLDSTNKETPLWTFTGGADGASSTANVVMDSQGNLYGTTNYGGDLSGANCVPSGCGVVFKLTPQ
jgi:uncharacterized repeat protein (TIGR03803 family)